MNCHDASKGFIKNARQQKDQLYRCGVCTVSKMKQFENFKINGWRHADSLIDDKPIISVVGF